MRIGFLGLLSLILITLRLTHVVDLSWWWVTAPLWGGAALVGLVSLVGFIGLLIVAWSD